MGALPLRNLSRVWGYMNSVELPVWFRPTGFRIYSWIFGCNINEVEHDLNTYTSLGDFFYRRLKDGSRPAADSILVSHFPSLRVTSQLTHMHGYRLVPPTERFYILVPLKAVASNKSKAAHTLSTPFLGSRHPRLLPAHRFISPLATRLRFKTDTSRTSMVSSTAFKNSSEHLRLLPLALPRLPKTRQLGYH